VALGASAGSIALGALGAALVLAAAMDLFLTVFNHDGFRFIASRYQRALWRVIRTISAVIPGRRRHSVLSIASAGLLPATVALWLALEIVGFALMFLPGLHGSAYAVKGVDHTFGSALYLSAGAISSLTFGDILARGGLARALIDLETIVGLSTFTLALGYVVTTFGVLSALDELHGLVHRHAEHPERPSSIVARHFRGGNATDLPSFLQELGDKLESYDQGLRRYPVVYTFHTRRHDRSIPHIFATLGELIELLRFGLPSSEQITKDPYLAALADGYVGTIERLQQSFVGPHPFEPPQPLARAAFIEAYERGDGGLVGEFRELEQHARDAADLHDARDEASVLYERYEAWLPFHCLHRVVLDRVADSLVYERPSEG
jgi:hypothetical protein